MLTDSPANDAREIETDLFPAGGFSAPVMFDPDETGQTPAELGFEPTVATKNDNWPWKRSK